MNNNFDKLRKKIEERIIFLDGLEPTNELDKISVMAKRTELHNVMVDINLIERDSHNQIVQC